MSRTDGLDLVLTELLIRGRVVLRILDRGERESERMKLRRTRCSPASLL
jgi:hypothetical protein